MPIRFPTKLDNLARMITTVVPAVLIIPFITILQQVIHTHSLRLVLAPVFIIAILGIAVLLRVTAYSLDGEGLHIHRPLNTVHIPLRDISSIEPVRLPDLGFGIRTFGSGGFLGYFGKFWYKKLGHVTLYATDRDKMLLLKLKDDRKILISPDDQTAFLLAFRELL